MSKFQPRPKAPAVANISALSTLDPPSRSETPMSQQGTRLTPIDPTSSRATQYLIRRTLCSQLGDKGPIDEILPPLTSSNDVDVELYAYIAIIIREFVHTWYQNITPDTIFVEEVIQIIAHCTRALEQRMRKVDLEGLIFDELPELLEIHFQAYQTSTQALHPPPFRTDSRTIYHSLCPFPALSPVPDPEIKHAVEQQAENEAAYRQLLVQGVMAVLLPTEDLESDCLTSLVGQIFSEMIIGNGIGGKASEPWLLWEGITKTAEVIQSKLPNSKAQVRLERSNSVSSDHAFDVISGSSTKGWRILLSAEKLFWLALQYAFFTFTTIRFIIITIATSSSLPTRNPHDTKITGSASFQGGLETPNYIRTKRTASISNPSLKEPIIKMKIWSCVSSLLDVDTRMPWMSATISMSQWFALTGPGEVGNTDGMVDKILSNFIQTHVLDPTLIPLILRTARAAVFPSNTLAPARAIPTATEQLVIRQRCAETLLSLVPTRLLDVYFGPDGDRRVREVEDVLDMFGDTYCNKHLLYGVVELIVVRLLPELAEKGVEELLNERLG
ncbi:PXA domain-containing protein [Calycina marina]|uniref:PXA domain-containing protein n=1 Tax=Calycina marina TaxID=1763456 RepID=A0A9P8CGL6_9HELO|nr:PXA domain-containing protein [Calycina marina]